MAMPANWVKAFVAYGSDQQQPFVNVLYYEMSAAPAGDLQTFANAAATNIDSELRAYFLDLLCTTSVFFGVVVDVNLSGLAYHGESATAVEGGNIADSDEHPGPVAVVIQKRTSQPGKSGRGRWYIAAVPELHTDSNKLTNPGKAEYAAVAEHLNATVVVSGINLAPRHYSKKLNALFPMVALKVNRYLGRQDRRAVRPFMGQN